MRRGRCRDRVGNRRGGDHRRSEPALESRPQRAIHRFHRCLPAEGGEARHAVIGDSTRHDAGVVGEVRVDVEADAVEAHAAADADAHGRDFRLLRRIGFVDHPDADAARTDDAFDAKGRKGVDQPALEGGHEGADVGAETALHVQHDVGDALSGTMVGVLAAAPALEDGEAVGRLEVGGVGARAGRIEGLNFLIIMVNL